MPSAALVARAYADDPDVLEPLQAYQRRIVSSSGEQKVGAWQMVPNVGEALATAGHPSLAAGCYMTICRAFEGGGLVTLSLRLWQMVAGIAAACGQHWETAQAHYETALKQAHDLPHRIAQPEVRRWYACMLVDRNQPGDMEKARTLLDEAVEMYDAIGMPKRVELAKQLRARI